MGLLGSWNDPRWSGTCCIGLIILAALRDKHKVDALSAKGARAMDAQPAGKTMPFRLSDWKSPGAAQPFRGFLMNNNLRTTALLVCFALFLVSATYLPYEYCDVSFRGVRRCSFEGWKWINQFAGENELYWSFLILEWVVLVVSVGFLLFLFRKQ